MLLYSTHILYQTKTSANEKRRPYSLHYKILKVPFPIILIIYRQSNINQIAFQGNTINSFHIAICAFSFHIQPLYLYYNLSYIYHHCPAHAGRQHLRHPGLIRPHTHFLSLHSQPYPHTSGRFLHFPLPP